MPFVQRVIEPKFLSRTSLFDDDGRPRIDDDELEAVTNSTLTNALRQLASLALAANDIFVDLAEQLRDVARRTDALKGKIGSLETRVSSFDPKKVAVPESDICTFAHLKEHHKSKHELQTNLFSASTRPSAVQALYEASAKTPIPIMRQLDRLRRDGRRSSAFFVCTPVLGARQRKIRNRVDLDIESRVPAAVEDLRRWTSSEALGDITVAPDCLSRIVPNVTVVDGNVSDGAIVSDDEGVDHKLPSPEEQVQVIALKFPAEIVAVDITGKPFNRMSIQRRSLLHADISNRNEGGDPSLRRQTRQRRSRSRRRNTLAGTDQKEIETALTLGENLTEPSNKENEIINGPVFRSKSSDILRSSPKKEKDSTIENKKSHFYTLKQWGMNRLKMINRSSSESPPKPNENSPTKEDEEYNIYERVSVKRKRSLSRDKRANHERKPSYSSSSEKSSINIPITTPLSAAMNIAVRLRESSTQRRLRRTGNAKDEPHSSSGNWSASSESGRTSIGSEIVSTSHPKSSTSNGTSTNSLNAPNSVNSRRKFINTSGSSSITSEGTLTPDIHDFHEDGETSSVYSCDTEGYYTSFHLDSGLKTLKEEDMPVTPLHCSTAFSNSSSSNTVINAENEYELFGKGSTSTTASSAGTVCTTLKATGSSKSLLNGPAVPERKSSLSKLSTKANSPTSSLEREFSSDKTGTVKRSPSSTKATVVAMIHKEINGDVSPDSGHNTSSSPIESANSPNGIRSGSEFEFSECSDMEGADRIERIRVKTTINSSRIPSMCVITPPHSDDESVKSNNNQMDDNRNNICISNMQNQGKPMETDLDNLEYINKSRKSSENAQIQLINVNPVSGYATIETINNNNYSGEQFNVKNNAIHAVTNVRAPSPSGGSVVVVKEEEKLQNKPIFKATLMPFNTVLGKLKSNFSNFSKREMVSVKPKDEIDNLADDFGDYVTIADVKNNNEKANTNAFKETKSHLQNSKVQTEYVSLNELPYNNNNHENTNDNSSLERKRRQGARVTLDAEGKVVYSSDSLKRRKGAHTTFEPGPYVKDVESPLNSPISAHRNLKTVRTINNGRNQQEQSKNCNLRPMSPKSGKYVIRAASGTISPVTEIIRVPPSKIVTPAARPTSPKPNNARGAYVRMQDAQGSASSPSYEKEPVHSPFRQPSAYNWTSQQPTHFSSENKTANSFQQNIIMEAHIPEQGAPFTKDNSGYIALFKSKPAFNENYNGERPITPDIMRGLPNNMNTFKVNVSGNYLKHLEGNSDRQIYVQRDSSPKLGIPVRLPHIQSISNMPEVPYSSQANQTILNTQLDCAFSPKHFVTDSRVNESLRISPIDPRNLGEFKSSTPSKSHQDIKSAINLDSILLSPKKSTMSSEELYAVIHKNKKKLNINNPPPENQMSSSPSFAKHTTPESKIKMPETGYLKERPRSRFSWSPSDGDYVDYNTNVDVSSPSPETDLKTNRVSNDRKGNIQTSRLDFKKLLLHQSSKQNLTPIGAKKMSAVEQLKLSKQQPPPITAKAKNNYGDMDILDLSRSPKNFQNRRTFNSLPGSPKNENKQQKPAPKLMSPRSQWRFANPRSDVLSSTIHEDCREEETTNITNRRSDSPLTKRFHYKDDIKVDSLRKPSQTNYNSYASLPREKTSSQSGMSVSQLLRMQRAQFFGNTTYNETVQSEANSKVCSSPPTLETAF